MNKNKLITKTDFVRYLECPLYSWLWKNRADLKEGYNPPRLSEQGIEVEKIARKLFAEGVEVIENYEAGKRQTEEFIKQGAKVIYQATALTDKCLARADILVRSGDGWDLFEVKSSTEDKKEHIADLAFQLHAFTKAGYVIKSCNLVLVNDEYVYDGKKGLEPDKFFVKQDLTAEIHTALAEYEPLIEQAFGILTAPNEPKIPSLKKKFKNPLPPKMEEYYWKGIPDYSIYDITRISAKNLAQLNADGISKIEEIPDGFLSSDSQNEQVALTKSKGVAIDRKAIQKELKGFKCPIYFLDYETINPAIPLFDRTKPHQHIPFQYSLHILSEPNGEIKHEEFLHMENSSPIPAFVESLRQHIKLPGTVIVWNDTFEMGVNKAIAESYPDAKEFMEALNASVFDLMKLVKDHYKDYRFKGSVSIKNVLPIMAPELDYKALEIQHGVMAMDGIMDLIDIRTKNKAELIANLQKYCELDTWAMVRIFQELETL